MKEYLGILVLIIVFVVLRRIRREASEEEITGEDQIDDLKDHSRLDKNSIFRNARRPVDKDKEG